MNSMNSINWKKVTFRLSICSLTCWVAERSRRYQGSCRRPTALNAQDNDTLMSRDSLITGTATSRHRMTDILVDAIRGVMTGLTAYACPRTYRRA